MAGMAAGATAAGERAWAATDATGTVDSAGDDSGAAACHRHSC